MLKRYSGLCIGLLIAVTTQSFLSGMENPNLGADLALDEQPLELPPASLDLQQLEAELQDVQPFSAHNLDERINQLLTPGEEQALTSISDQATRHMEALKVGGSAALAVGIYQTEPLVLAFAVKNLRKKFPTRFVTGLEIPAIMSVISYAKPVLGLMVGAYACKKVWNLIAFPIQRKAQDRAEKQIAKMTKAMEAHTLAMQSAFQSHVQTTADTVKKLNNESLQLRTNVVFVQQLFEDEHQKTSKELESLKNQLKLMDQSFARQITTAQSSHDATCKALLETEHRKLQALLEAEHKRTHDEAEEVKAKYAQTLSGLHEQLQATGSDVKEVKGRTETIKDLVDAIVPKMNVTQQALNTLGQREDKTLEYLKGNQQRMAVLGQLVRQKLEKKRWFGKKTPLALPAPGLALDVRDEKKG